MNNLSCVLKKWVMALSGLFLCSFLVVHLSGNLFLLNPDGGALFNQYANFMSTNLWIRVTEIILALGFVVHIVLGMLLARQANQSRPVAYAVSPGNETSSFASRYMWLTGAFVLFFLVVHLKTFFYTMRFGDVPHVPYEVVKAAFESPIYVIFYLISFFVLGWHLRHGVTSSFQSLGIRHPKLKPWIHIFGGLFWFVIPLAYSVIPLYFLYFHMWG